MNIYLFELKRSARALFWWTLILSGMMAVYIGFFPDMKDLAQAKFDALPEGLLKVFGFEAGMNFTEFHHYFAMIVAYMFMALAAYAAILGVSALSREESEGTIEFLYAQPITRAKIALAKIGGVLTNLIIVGAAMLATVIGMVALNGNQMGDADVVVISTVFKLTFIPLFAYAGVGMLLSTALSRTAKATSLALALFFGTYMLGVFSTMYENLAWLRWASPLHWVPAADIVNSTIGIGTETFSYTGAIVGGAVALVSFAAAVLVYRKKDLQSRA